MNIPRRIETIAKFIGSNDNVADIGADHGLLEQYLIVNDHKGEIFAIENKIGPFKTLEKNLKAVKNVRISLSNGIKLCNSSIETVVLAGMGGQNIINILNEWPKKVQGFKKIIVDAHRDIDLVRRNIVNYGYKISEEKIVYEDDIYYVIIKFENIGEVPNYTHDEFDIGFNLYKDPLWNNYKNYLVNINEKTIQKIKGIDDVKVNELMRFNERLNAYGKN